MTPQLNFKHGERKHERTYHDNWYDLFLYLSSLEPSLSKSEFLSGTSAGAFVCSTYVGLNFDMTGLEITQYI